MVRRLPVLLLLLLSLVALAEPLRTLVQQRWGWSPGVVAANMGEALATVEPVHLAIPAEIAARVQGPTALFYFSPSCPHCQHAMPEINDLVRLQPDLAWVGVASGGALPEEITAFAREYKVGFPLLHDRDRGFALATGIRSTPSVLLVEPAAPGVAPSRGEPVGPGQALVTVVEAHLPFARGSGAVIAMRRNALGQRRDAQGKPMSPDPFRDFHGYQGVRACSTCHADESTSWSLTRHASAYLTLYTRDRAEDPACVGCHVVGLGQGGFVKGDHSSPHADVGCEACHGPGGAHNPSGRVPAAQATGRCVACHDDKHSIAFTVAKGMPHIDHFLAAGMETEELRRRLAELESGAKERPLLAFPEGPTVGAASCRSCHKAVHKGWSRHPHAQAMVSLGADAARPECATCHATRRSYGGMQGPASSLDELRTDEGVGCEACHGPGEAHAAAPSKENIVRLGESCPVCVLEGICTSCHTPQWDPGWDLDRRLGALPYGK